MVKEIVILQEIRGERFDPRPRVAGPRKLAIQGQTAQAAQAYAKALAEARIRIPGRESWTSFPQFHGVLTALHRLLPNDKQIEEVYRRMVEKTTAEFSRKLDALTRVIQNQPDRAAGYLARGDWYGRLGHWQKAADDYGAAYRLQADPLAGKNLGILLVWIGKADRYREHCQELLDRLAGTSANHEAEWASRRAACSDRTRSAIRHGSPDWQRWQCRATRRSSIASGIFWPADYTSTGPSGTMPPWRIAERHGAGRNLRL